MYDYSMEELVYQMFILGCDDLDEALKNWDTYKQIFWKKE